MRLQNVGADTPRNWNPAFRVPHQPKGGGGGGGGGGGKLGRKNTNVVSYFPTLKGEPRMERLRAYRHKDMAMLLDADFRVTGWTAETSPVVLGTGKRAQEFTPDFRVHEGDRAYSVRVTLPGAKPSEARRERHAAVNRAYREHDESLVVVTAEELAADPRLEVAKELFRNRRRDYPAELPEVLADAWGPECPTTLGAILQELGGGIERWLQLLCLAAQGFLHVPLDRGLEASTPVLACTDEGYRS